MYLYHRGKLYVCEVDANGELTKTLIAAKAGILMLPAEEKQLSLPSVDDEEEEE